MKEPPTFAEIGQKIAEFIQSPNPAIQHLKKPQELTWTTEYPTQPGYYWLRNYILSADPKMQPASKLELVLFTAQPDGFLLFRRAGDNRTWCVGDFISAEWFGPIQPPADKEGK